MKGELQGKGRRTSPRDKESAKGRCIQGRGSALRAGAYRGGEAREGERVPLMRRRGEKRKGMKSAKGTGAAHRKGKGRCTSQGERREK